MASNDLDGTVSEGGSGLSRRDALKKGAVVGGAVLWATPVVQSIGISPAAATHVSGHPAGCPCTTCIANATGLRALGVTVGGVANGTNGPNCQCVADAVVTSIVGSADAEVICASANNATCNAQAYVAGLRVLLLAVPLVSNTFLEVSALGSCVSCGTGDSYIADIDVVVRAAIGGAVISRTAVTLDIISGCTSGVSLLNGLVAVLFNEQVCTNGVLTVNALRVTVAGLTVIAAQSQAGAVGCTCTPCGPPLCRAPRVALCP